MANNDLSTIKKFVFILFVIITFTSKSQENPPVYCNPLNLNYQFQPQSPSRREAADPVIHLFKKNYFLYASKSRGYWMSSDLLKWSYIPCTTIPIWDYAPTVTTINDTVYFIASTGECNLYYNPSPEKDNWKIKNNFFHIKMTDPCLFTDDNGKVYLYYGCSNTDPIMGVELDPKNNLNPKGQPAILIEHNRKEHGWEESGEFNQLGTEGWNEGAWMNKYNGKYYLQYASPGTEVKVYADGVYVSENPLGPFKYQEYSPFSYKPTGFSSGAGHGCTFKDKYGNYWHIATSTISIRHMFERRLSLFPASFDNDGVLRTFTAFGDYPIIVPKDRTDFSKSNPAWMLLSYNKPAIASSFREGWDIKNAFDEDIRTWWTAQTGNKGEWISVDLLNICTINAVQANFADQDAVKLDNNGVYYQFIVWASENGTDWFKIADKKENKLDAPHDFIILKEPISARYVKLENVSCMGSFSVSDFRIFGKGIGSLPEKVDTFSIKRNVIDGRKALVKWQFHQGTTGYIVNYGIHTDKLYTSVMVYNDDNLQLTGLNRNVEYYFSIDAFNENGLVKGTKVIKME